MYQSRFSVWIKCFIRNFEYICILIVLYYVYHVHIREINMFKLTSKYQFLRKWTTTNPTWSVHETQYWNQSSRRNYTSPEDWISYPWATHPMLSKMNIHLYLIELSVLLPYLYTFYVYLPFVIIQNVFLELKRWYMYNSLQ
jgi:hypothetical protein